MFFKKLKKRQFFFINSQIFLNKLRKNEAKYMYECLNKDIKILSICYWVHQQNSTMKSEMRVNG